MWALRRALEAVPWESQDGRRLERARGEVRQVRFRYALGPVQARSRYGPGTVQVLSRYGPGTLQVRSRCAPGTIRAEASQVSVENL